MKAYIAGGWFNSEQVQALNEVLTICAAATIDVYSPRDEQLYEPGGKIVAQKIFTDNLTAIQDADFVIASTAGKDMGTLFECGYACAIGKPIVYYFKSSGNFNLMLSESGHAVCTEYSDLLLYLKACAIANSTLKRKYEGPKE